jgi:AcrR family transcriptional regulator
MLHYNHCIDNTTTAVVTAGPGYRDRMAAGIQSPDTRTRLLDAAMELFAERGYTGSTVGEIERVAGLAPRSGALYQYFSGKEDLLHAALERELGAVDELASVIENLPTDDVRGALTRLAEWNLASLSRRRNLNRFIARDGDRLPERLQAQLYERLVARPFEQVVEILRAVLPPAAAGRFDVEALALIFVQAMAGYRNMESTFGKVVGDVDDERFVRSWVEVALAVARDAGVR